MDAFVRARVARGERALEARWYRSPEIFARERERIFARDWICAGRLEQVERGGDFFTVEIAGESLIVVRGGDARVRAFYNVCRHRGTRLCTEPSGRFAGSLQCPYHAWTYALDGSLLSARTMADVDGFDRADYPLREAHVAEFEGFVFVSIADRPEPFEAAFAPLLGTLRAVERRRAANRAHDRVRIGVQLEAGLPKLLGVLSLPAAAPAARGALAVGQRPQRSVRRPVSRRLFRAAPARHEPGPLRDDQPAAARRRGRRRAGPRVLLHDLSVAAAELAPGLRHGALRHAARGRPHADRLRVAVRSG